MDAKVREAKKKHLNIVYSASCCSRNLEVVPEAAKIENGGVCKK